MLERPGIDMKIWQRIFLITLIIAMSVMIVEFIIINEQFEEKIDAEINNSLELHAEIYQSIQGKINNRKLIESKELLPQEQYEELFDLGVKEKQYTEYGIQMVTEDEFTVTNYHFYSTYTDDMHNESISDVKYKIRYWRDKYELTMKSINTFDYISVTTISQYDLTSIYDMYESQLDTLKKTGLVLLLEAALILLMVITSLMIPLKKVQTGIRDITDGNYGKQLKWKGNTEISELTREINQMSEKIAQYISEIEEMAENRRIFIGNMAHEMKTPLTGILGFADILTIKPNITDEQKIEYSEHIYKEALRLRSMSGKLLELVQLQGDSLRPEMVNMDEFMQDVIDTERVIFEKDNISLRAQLCDATVNADPDLLKSLFYNILDNAHKATEDGGRIDLVMTISGGSVQIKITDYGIGIPSDDIKKITEPFYMVDKSRTRKRGGAGLGLALCQKIVELNSGTLDIESQEGKGCTVIVTLPLVED